MNSKLRRQKLLDELNLHGMVDTAAFAKQLGVSAMTIRRDLQKFATDGLVSLTYGGAELCEGATSLLSVSVRERHMTREKNAIADICAQFIKPGYAVYLDTGSTAISIANSLIDMQDIAVITNSLPALDILSDNNDIQLIALAGIYKHNCKGFFGDMTIRQIKNFRVDIAFIGVDAFSLEWGLMSPDNLDAALKLAVIESARKKYLVSDHTKINEESLFRICDLKVMDKIILDKPPDDKFASGAKKLGIEILYP